ncbi:MAG: hypothetical protein QF752_16150 [Planctomycetota bacterium]|nr:hypothetical protein [Planctomycetota bacterium]
MGEQAPIVTALLAYIFLIHIRLYRHELLLSSSARSMHMKKLQLGLPYQIGKMVFLLAVLVIGYQVIDFYQRNTLHAAETPNVSGQSENSEQSSKDSVQNPAPENLPNTPTAKTQGDSGHKKVSSKPIPKSQAKPEVLKETKTEGFQKAISEAKNAKSERPNKPKVEVVKEKKVEPKTIPKERKNILPKEKTPAPSKDGLNPFKEKW